MYQIEPTATEAFRMSFGESLGVLKCFLKIGFCLSKTFEAKNAYERGIKFA